jgi:Protein of unknown function (DUF2586)
MANDVLVEFDDGNLGLLPGGGSVHLKIGTCSLGQPNVLTSVRTTKQVKERLGTGRLAESAASSIGEKAAPVLVVPATPSTGGIDAIVHTGTGTAVLNDGDGSLVESQPLDAYEVIIRITKAGVNLVAGTAAYIISLDGGDTFEDERAVPINGIIEPENTGLTLTFTTGTFVVGDEYTLNTSAPSASVSSIIAALGVALADPRPWRFVHIIGAATPALAAAVNVKMQEATLSKRYTRAILEYRGKNAGETDAQYEAAFIADFGNFTSSEGRVAIVVGDVELTSPLTGRSNKVNWAQFLTGRIARRSVAEDAGRVRTGAADGVTKLYYDGADETLNAVRAITPHPRFGRQGVYSSRGYTMAPNGSDYKFLQHGFIADKVATVGGDAALKYLNDQIAVDPVTGFIDETEAQGIEADIGGVLRAALVEPGELVNVEVVVERQNNILSTEELILEYIMTPFGYAGTIRIRIGYRNPRLIPAPPQAQAA